jgi:hypothetical protein
MGLSEGWLAALGEGFGTLGGGLAQIDQERKAKRRREEEDMIRASEKAADRKERQDDRLSDNAREVGRETRRLQEREEDKAYTRGLQRQKDEDLRRGRTAALRAAALNPDVPASVRKQLESGDFDALDPSEITAMLVTPYARTATREDNQSSARDLAILRAGLARGNDESKPPRPTEKAAFAERMLDANTAAGGQGKDFWAFLDTIGADDADEAARLKMTRNDYLAAYARQNRRGKERSSSRGGGRPAARFNFTGSDTTTTPKPRPTPPSDPKGKTPRWKTLLGEQ